MIKNEPAVLWIMLSEEGLTEKHSHKTYNRRLGEVQDIVWTPYVRSIYALSLVGAYEGGY